MSTGISISSINRIKELAEEKKFKEALEILDTQNIDKSINPQFMKISGEVFRENKRYYDSRRILLKAHQMAPQGNRILFELIQLYLELGYFSKAEKYYEQYMFYATSEDTQKDYVEYMMKKATGADVKDLATILIPILERMPEDKWNFEAILLYDKMGRKDMALEESRYILENFKDSEYVQPVIAYIDDKLDIDEHFYIYPREEQEEDVELFGDLIEQEAKILEADHLRMYPPEARIMVQADDNDAYDAPPVKEKKPKKKRKSKKELAAEDVAKATEVAESADADGNSDEAKKDGESQDTKTTDKVTDEITSKSEDVSKDSDAKSVSSDESVASGLDEKKADGNSDKSSVVTSKVDSEQVDSREEATDKELSEEEMIQKEREEALEKILSKKFDKDKLKESVMQVAKAVKEIDTGKAKKQIHSVAGTVKDNVTKASDSIGEAVGTKKATEVTDTYGNVYDEFDENNIMDGIIESVLEPPKKAVGQVVMNEELDALIPDSLEAMSEQEIADIEAKKEEIERLELEALEATLKMEEEKKAKRRHKSKDDSEEESKDGQNIDEATEEESAETDEGEESTEKKDAEEENTDKVLDDSKDEADTVSDEESSDMSLEEKDTISETKSSYSELKSRFLENLEEEKPLESLGFITVVHSDVDAAMEEAMPDAAGMLRQMIGNKEYYSGENSLGFESEASYQNHGFEVEDYDFDTYRKMQEEEMEASQSEEVVTKSEEVTSVQDIFTKDEVFDFDDMATAIEEVSSEEPLYKEAAMAPAYDELTYAEPLYAEPVATATYETTSETPVVAVSEDIEEKPIVEETVSEPEEATITESVATTIYAESIEDVVEISVDEKVVEEVAQPMTYGESVEVEFVVHDTPSYEESITTSTYEEPLYEEPVTTSTYEDSLYKESVIEPTYGEALYEEPVATYEITSETPVVAVSEDIEEKPVVEEMVAEPIEEFADEVVAESVEEAVIDEVMTEPIEEAVTDEVVTESETEMVTEEAAVEPVEETVTESVAATPTYEDSLYKESVIAPTYDEALYEESMEMSTYEATSETPAVAVSEDIEEKPVIEEIVSEPEKVVEQMAVEQEEETASKPAMVSIYEEPTITSTYGGSLYKESVTIPTYEESFVQVNQTLEDERTRIRREIQLSANMEKLLLYLKESR